MANSTHRNQRSKWRRATVWSTSLALSVMIALVPFARSSGADSSTAATTTAPNTAAIDTAVDDAVAAATGKVSVSVEDLSTGTTHTYGAAGHSFDTASIVKVDILSASLLQAQDEGRELTSAEKSLATRMIENSDNTAATALFNEVGGKSGIEAANKRLGLTETEIGSNGYWGLTQTTSADQIRLLEQVFTADSVLSTDSRSYIQDLMGNVESSQRFGVSAAADDSSEAELKVGWLQRSVTGLWVVNSIGMVESGGHSYLVAVLSDGNTTCDGGVAMIDAVAKAAVEATI